MGHFLRDYLEHASENGILIRKEAEGTEYVHAPMSLFPTPFPKFLFDEGYG
jgi:hypothetical protein